MKRFFLSLIVLASFTLIANAQTEAQAEAVEAQSTKRKGGYVNFSYTASKLKIADTGFSKNNDYGAAITRGRTYYLHKPIMGIISFGIDWTFFDLNFSQYSTEGYDASDGDDKIKIYTGEVGMHLGPSVTLTATKNFNISAYFRYAPSYAGYFDDDMEKFKGAYGSFFVSGVSASFGTFSLGAEQRWGEASFKFDDEDGESNTLKTKMETSGPRVYFGFRF